MRALPQRGFTLIEMMIALVILGFLAVLAVPMYGEMLTNSQIRNAAENILTGMRTAQAEAVHLNAPAKFVLSNSTGWKVYVTDPDTNDYAVAPWRQYDFSEGASRATVTTTAGSEVVFNGLGQIVKTVDTIPQVAPIFLDTPQHRLGCQIFFELGSGEFLRVPIQRSLE